MDLNPAAADTGAELSLANFPHELVIQIAAKGGFNGAAKLARTCHAYAGIVRELLANPALLSHTVRATESPQWLQWLVAHAQALRNCGASEAELARMAKEGTSSIEGEAAVRLLGLAVQHGELGLFKGVGVSAKMPLLQQRALDAAMLSAPRLEQVLTPHLAALEWYCTEQREGIDPLYTVGAVASLAELAVAEAPLIGRVLIVVCDGGQAVLLQQLLACDGFLEKLNSLDAFMGMKHVCNRGQAELLRPLLACGAFLARLPGWGSEGRLLRQVRMDGHMELLQLLLECNTFMSRLDSFDCSILVTNECCFGQADTLQQLLACAAFLERLEPQDVCKVLRQVTFCGTVEALRQLLACNAFLARLDSSGARSFLEYVHMFCSEEVQRIVLASEFFRDLQDQTLQEALHGLSILC